MPNSGTFANYFFNLASLDDKTCNNFLKWSFYILMALLCLSLPMYIDEIANALSRGMSVAYIVIYIAFFGSHMWITKSKILNTSNQNLLSHLEILRLGCTVLFYFGIVNLLFFGLLARYNWLNYIWKAVSFVTDVFFIFAAYTSLRRQRQGLAYGFDDD